MAEYLEYDELRELHKKSIDCGLNNDPLVFLGIDRGFVASLPHKAEPASKLMLALSKMNDTSVILKRQVVPLERWLRNASYACIHQPEYQRYFRELADRVAKVAPLHVRAEEKEDGDLTLDERIIHTDDKLPVQFLWKAQKAARSVARFIVTRHEGGVIQQGLSGKEIRYFGSGWLIGRRYVITNHHVINGREQHESDASSTDFDLQGKHAIVQLDYDNADAEGEQCEVDCVVAADKGLDFAILRLSKDADRAPLSLFERPISLPSDRHAAVNIVQHPAGAPKQIAIRNNLLVKLTERELAYFTDTEGGSSGSPVFNDRWEVIGLHKASTKAHGDFEFQGKKSAWVNIGTRIDVLVTHLKTSHGDLWREIDS